MSTIIGTVINIQGIFYTKDSSQNITQIHQGDTIGVNVIVFGDKNNPSSAEISIKLAGLDRDYKLRSRYSPTFRCLFS